MAGKVVLFHEETLSIRGSTRAVFDYARYNETILKNKSLIVYNSDHENNDSLVIEMFNDRFPSVYKYSEGEFQTTVPKICVDNKVDLLYLIKDGENDGKTVDGVRNVIHVMFGVLDPHGDVYAYVSKQESLSASYGYFPYLSHIVEIPQPNCSLRDRLGIPEEAFVLGRHGGNTTFDLPFVHREIQRIVERDPSIYLLLVNTDRFCNHERIIFLDGIVDVQEKSNFIGTCDVMLHARSRGESFGLAICEFLYLDKPIVCWVGGYDRNHVELIKNDPNLLYDEGTLISAINHARYNKRPAGYYHDLVNDFSPVNVMGGFEELFINSRSRRSFIGSIFECYKMFELNSRYLFYRLRKKIGIC